MKISKTTIKQIETEARTFFENASGCHDWTHVERVRALALRIGKMETADLGILEIATLLHDIGRSYEMKKGSIKFCHAEMGAKMAIGILNKHNIAEEDRENILHCILAHRNRNSHKPNTKEAMVLFDADKLDSIGAIGVARDFLFAGMAGSKNLYTGNEKKLAKTGKDYSYTKEDSAVLEYEKMLKFVKNKIITKTGKKIAIERNKFMDEYFRRFWLEVEGRK